MSIEPLAAEKQWFAIAPDGTEHDLILQIGVPMCESGGVWRASVSLGVLESRVHQIGGADSWQAITLAMQFTRTRLEHFVEGGWRLYWERDGDPALPSELLDVR